MIAKTIWAQCLGVLKKQGDLQHGTSNQLSATLECLKDALLWGVSMTVSKCQLEDWQQESDKDASFLFYIRPEVDAVV